MAWGSVWAQSSSPPSSSATTVPNPARLKPLADILADVQKRHAGRVVDIDLEQTPDGRRWYEIKMVNGQRTTLFVDAVTGQEIPEPGKGSDGLVSLHKVLRGLATTHPGLVLEAELEGGHGEPFRYDVKILGPQGEPYEVRVDALTGRALAGTTVQPGAIRGLLKLDGILETLEARYKARVTEAELKFTRTQRAFYEVELVLPSGRSLEVRVDARTGQPLTDEELDR